MFFRSFFSFFCTNIQKKGLRELFFQVVSPYSGCLFHYLRAGTLGVVLGGAGFGRGGCVGRTAQSQEVGTDECSVGLFELLGQPLHQSVVGGFALAISGVGASRFETGKEEHATGGSAGLTHTPYPTPKRGGHAQGLFFGEAIEVCKSTDNGLRAIEARLEKFDGTTDAGVEFGGCGGHF